MSDFPLGGNLVDTRAWLDSKGFVGSFVSWDADALLGLEKSDFQELVATEGLLCRADSLKFWALLNTARSLRQSNAEGLVDFNFQKYVEDPQSRYAEPFPQNGIGWVLLQRDDLVQCIINDITTNSCTSMYIRGPKGSGKTVLLKVIGRELQQRGKRVIFFDSASMLRCIQLSAWDELEDTTSHDEKVYVLIDEVPNDPNSEHWVHLLKNRSKKFVVIGAGVPTLEGTSPSFSTKLPATKMLLTEVDLTDRFIEQLSLEFDVSNQLSIRKVLSDVLDFTGGHVYPLVTLVEHFLTEHKDQCELGTIDVSALVKSESFANLPVVKRIASRCYDNISPVVVNYCTDIFTIESADDPRQVNAAEYLEKLGFFVQESNRFVSGIFLMLVFMSIGKANNRALAIDFGPPGAIFQIILGALSQLKEDHFYSGDDQRNEHAIGYNIGRAMASIAGVYVFPQYQIKRSTPGNPPTIDFYINGKVNTFVELTVNGRILESHFKRFEPGGDYAGQLDALKADFIVLDVELKAMHPKSVKEVDEGNVAHAEFEPLRNSRRQHHCTYVLYSNRFYHHGTTTLVPNVSRLIPSKLTDFQSTCTSPWTLVGPSYNLRSSAFHTLPLKGTGNSSLARKFSTVVPRVLKYF